MLVELQSDGKQTVVPPSIHESGEPITWESDAQPLVVDQTNVLDAVRWVAVAALLARHWPNAGSRHEAALALGGFLARLHLRTPVIARIVESGGAGYAGDDQPADRAKAAEDSATNFAAGRTVTGGPKLGKLIGDAVVARLHEWFGKPNAAPVAVVRRLSDVQPETVAWLWHPCQVPIGKVTLIEGNRGSARAGCRWRSPPR